MRLIILMMTYESVVSEMFIRVPYLRGVLESKYPGMEDNRDLPYVMFGAFLVPSLEEALEDNDTDAIRSICAYLEEVATSAKDDPRLDNLLGVEIGESLEGIAHEDRLAPFLGERTKQVCNYVFGLATQRRTLRDGGEK